MAAVATSAHRDTAEQNDKCYLLDLPRELRNCIYEFATKKNPVYYFPNRFKDGTDAQLNAAGVRRVTHDFFGLTQVCRQLRPKYTPIYIADAEIHVSHEDLEEFIAKGLPHLARDGDANVAGTLFVDLTSTIVFTGDYIGELVVDILPFLQYLKTKPSLRVQCGEHYCECEACQCDWNGQKGILNILFAISGNTKLQHWLETSTKAVKVGFCRGLSLVLEKGHMKEWMNVQSIRRYIKEGHPELQDWMAETGLKLRAGDNFAFRG